MRRGCTICVPKFTCYHHIWIFVMSTIYHNNSLRIICSLPDGSKIQADGLSANVHSRMWLFAIKLGQFDSLCWPEWPPVSTHQHLCIDYLIIWVSSIYSSSSFTPSVIKFWNPYNVNGYHRKKWFIYSNRLNWKCNLPHYNCKSLGDYPECQSGELDPDYAINESSIYIPSNL